jgi:cytochrome c
MFETILRPRRAVAIAALAACSLSLSPLRSMADGDPAAGKTVFNRCQACHATEAGASRLGPSLAGIVGRQSGSVPGFNYSPAMRDAHITWDDVELDKFLSNPREDVHGNRMMFPGVSNDQQRQDLIAYLHTLK